MPRRRQRQKTKNFSLTDFDVTKQPEKGLAEASSASLLEDSHNDSEMIIKERMEKKRKLLEKRYARKTRVQAKTQRHNWDFSELVPPTSVEDQDQTGTGSSDQDPRTETQTEDISNLIEDDVQEEEDEENDQTLLTEDPPEKRRTLDVDNLVEFDTDEEKTPVKVQKDKDDAQPQPMENLLEEKRTFDGDNLLAFDTDEEETPVKKVKEKDDGQAEAQVVKHPREKKRTFESTSLVEFDTDEEEETLVVTRQKRSKRNPITDSDFQDITQTVQKVDTPDRQSAGIETAEASPAATKSYSLTQNESVVTRRSARISRENLSDVEKTLSRQERSSFINKSQTKKSKLPPIHNTPSPPQSPREQREEVSEEVIEEEMVESPERMVERKGRKSVYEAGLGMAGRSLLDGTVVFRPETESTRIASLSDFNLGPSSPLQRGQQMAKPGRDTSTPFAKAYRQEFLSKTAQVTGEERRVVRVNQTIDPQMPTPKILEVVKEARKSGLRSMRLSRYQSTIREDIIEGGTQTTPQVQDDNVEAGCQVTPGLMEQHSAVGNQNFSAEVNDSLTEEVNIELPQEDHNDESFQPNISNSGRKNPSPIIERRSEVEAEENDEEYSENDDEEVVEAEENDDEEVFEKEEMINNEDEMITDQVEVAEADPGAGSLAYLRLPEPGSSKALPKRREQKELRQATLERYLGDFRTTASPLVLSPLNSPQKEKAVEKPKAKPKSKTNKKADPGLIFGEKQIKFEYQRFSRYKLKKDAEKTLVKASKDFLNEALKQMSSFAEERGAETIHLCDIKRMMIQCQFIPSQEEDPKERDFHQTLHDIARFEQIEELIPCNRGLGWLTILIEFPTTTFDCRRNVSSERLLGAERREREEEEDVCRDFIRQNWWESEERREY